MPEEEPRSRDQPVITPEQPIEDVNVHYGPGTKPQQRLPFSVYIRRRYAWWPGSERYGRLIDRLFLAAALCPLVIWAGSSYGWASILFAVAEAFILAELVYRFSTGNLLGD